MEQYVMAKGLVDVLILCGVLSACCGAARGDEGLLPGHSHYGEEFNQGPRQKAYLMGGTGDVHFAVSSKNPLVQKFIEQGIGQLHGFWFSEAERSFRQAARLDPNCGIAYWGMAQAAQLNPARAAQFAAEAVRHKTGLSERERMYIDALTNDSGYRALMAKYPDDLEAKAFEIWRLFPKGSATGAAVGDLDYAMGLAHTILRVNPMHPIHHAVIHIADSTNRYRSGLESAAKSGDSAPSIGHMWHMPAHIYTPLKRYAEAAWQLEASLRTENARAMHDHVVPYHVDLYAHSNEWLVRMLLHLGRVRDARRVAKEMIDMPRHPLFNALEPPAEVGKRKGTKGKNEDEAAAADDSAQEQPHESHGTSAFYGRERLMQVLQRFELWDELIEDCNSGYLEMTHLPAEQGKLRASLGIAYYCSNDLQKGDQELAALRQLRDEQRTQSQTALEEASRRPELERASAVGAVQTRFGRPLSRLDSQIAQLESYRAIVAGFFLSRGRLLVYLGLLVVGEAALFWFLRRRMLTAILTAVGAVLVAGWLFYCHLALVNLPSNATNVDFAVVTRKQLDVGDFEQAEWSARQFASERPHQVRPQANLVEVLYQAGKKAEARDEFETLRELAGTADLDTPPLARLAPIAREFGLPTDWRLPQKIQQALAGRRPLPSLGPFEWRPWFAPDWKLTDSEGRVHTLSEYRGKPVVLLFFLGRGCLHCQQQLAAFAKKADQYKEAGLTVIAISTDDQAGIKKSLADLVPKQVNAGRSTGGAFPYLMLADPDSTAFRSYGAYDDFEQISLHGTFLVDTKGFVRWNDVSFEPFLDAGFLLTEAKRLLSRPVAPFEPDARVVSWRND
ncbi:MAG TPA: peroxiredoxin family protein [Planctomycetaceae bacterium]|nr:peroxiredoxin family protein [Planctomycetaceae bacterium]